MWLWNTLLYAIMKYAPLCDYEMCSSSYVIMKYVPPCDYEIIICSSMWLWNMLLHVIMKYAPLCDYEICTSMWLWNMHFYVIMKYAPLCDYEICTSMWWWNMHLYVIWNMLLYLITVAPAGLPILGANLENSHLLECHFLHFQQQLKMYFTQNQAIVTRMTYM